MEVPPNYGRFTDTLRTWGKFQPAASRRPLSWESALLLLQLAQNLDQCARSWLKDALAQSEKVLSPLGEPLTLNLGTHRWLSADREESYSDWLAWILQGMSGSDILTLFSLGDKCSVELTGVKIRVDREVGREHARTDIEVYFGSLCFLLIEVKVKDVGAEISDQLQRYAKELIGQHNPLFVLLGTEAPETDVKKCGFTFVRWDALCQRLRNHANRVKNSDILRAAAILIFCSAAEQNLLGLSATPRPFRATATADYLLKWRCEE